MRRARDHRPRPAFRETVWSTRRLQRQAGCEHLTRERIGVERALEELADFFRFGVELAGEDAGVIAVPHQLGFQVVDLKGQDRLDRSLPQVLMGNQGAAFAGLMISSEECVPTFGSALAAIVQRNSAHPVSSGFDSRPFAVCQPRVSRVLVRCANRA